jgi:TP901 family phage tail tape measure protein
MANNSRNLALRLLINAEDRASAVLNGLRNNAGKVAAAIAGYFSISAFKGMADDAAAFERQMATVAAVSGVTGEDLKKLEQAAKDMGASTEFSAMDAAQALESLGRSGLNAEQQMQALPQVLALAQANGLELGQAASFITQTVSGMGLSFGDSARVADVLTKAASSANTSVEGLGSALSYAAPVAQSLGLTLEQTTAYLASLANAGIDASRAGTSLNGMMIQFQDPASKFRRELQALGINTTDFNEALVELAKKGKEGEGAILALGSEAGPAMRALLNQGIPSVQKLTDTLNNAAGAAKTAAATMTDNLVGSVRNLDSVWEGLRLQMAQPILEPLKNAINFVSGKLQALVDDGTISRVGDFIADTFDRGAKAFESFIGKVDFSVVGAAANNFGQNFKIVFNAGVEIAGTLADSIGRVYAALNASGAFDSFKAIATTAIKATVDSVHELSRIVTEAFTVVAESKAFNEFADATKIALETVIAVGKSLSEPFADLFKLLGDGKGEAQSFGQSFGQVLTTLTQTVTLFVSGFSTGLETIRVAFYGIAGAGAQLISTLVNGIAATQEGLAKITFGDVSRKWAEAAADNRLIAESFAESAGVNFAKAEAAMNGVSTSAQRTNASLMTLVGDGLQQSNTGLSANAQASQQAKAAGDALAGSAAQWVNPHADLVEQLRQQRNALIATGASQAELQQVSAKLTKAQDDAKTAAEQHAAAMKNTGTSANTAAGDVGGLNKQVSDLPKEPKQIYINADTREASDRISEIKAPTASVHTVDAAKGVSQALGEISQLKQPTSSVHTVYVNRVDNGSLPVQAAGDPAAQATGGPAGQPTGQPWRFNAGGYAPRSGKLPGFGGGDKIRALLEAGEFIIRKEAVQQLGLPFLHAINAGRVPTAGDVIKRALGGPVGYDLDEELRKKQAEREKAIVERIIGNPLALGLSGTSSFSRSKMLRNAGKVLSKIGRADLAPKVGELMEASLAKTGGTYSTKSKLGDRRTQFDKAAILKAHLFDEPASAIQQPQLNIAPQLPALQTPKINIPLPTIPRLPEAPAVPTATPISDAPASIGNTQRIQFISPKGESLAGTFNAGDAEKMLRILKDSGAITV